MASKRDLLNILNKDKAVAISNYYENKAKPSKEETKDADKLRNQRNAWKIKFDEELKTYKKALIKKYNGDNTLPTYSSSYNITNETIKKLENKQINRQSAREALRDKIFHDYESLERQIMLEGQNETMVEAIMKLANKYK